MDWTIDAGKIKADGKDQDFATYLWTLVPNGQSVSITRKLILQEKRLPILARLGFGPARDAALQAARKVLGQVETIPLVQDGQPCAIPAAYRQEIGPELRKGNAASLAAFLGI